MNEKERIQQLLALKNEELHAAKLRFHNVIAQNADGILIIDKAGLIRYANQAAQELLQRDQKDLVGTEFGFPVAEKNAELTINTFKGEIFFVEMRIADSEWEGEKESLVSLRDVTDRKLRQQELEIITSLNNSLRKAESVQDMVNTLLQGTMKNLRAKGAALWLESDVVNQESLEMRLGTLSARSFAECETLVKESIGKKQADQEAFVTKMELTRNQGSLGTIFLERNYPFNQFDLEVLKTISEIASSSLHRSIMFDETNRRVEHLSALRDIDQAIASSLDVQLTLKIVIGHILKHVGGDSVCAFLFNQDASYLNLVAANGDARNIPSNLRIKVSGDVISEAIMDHTMVQVPSINEANLNPRLKKLFLLEQYACMQIIPFLARGKSFGAMIVLHKHPCQLGLDGKEFAETLVTQASIGIDNANLFEDIQHFNTELRKAYDETIEGWARAINMRNQETAEHTRRVAEMTLAIAEQFFSFSQKELQNIWYGALLHDIGKIAVPDEILFKPGRLTDEEWVIMKRHPQAAYDMLSSIAYLKEALNIPHYHHEKWNGEGYPTGLSGTAIPLAARLFAVVDVWDALVSDRPYRKAWTHERALNLIREQSGIHFDPDIVPIFLDYVEKFITGEVAPAILIVDDETHILSSLERSLRDEYDVHITESAKKAIEIVQNVNIQIALVDQRMPEMVGVELLKQLKKINPDLVGILISAYTDTPALVEALNLGFVRGFIGKPWNITDVKDRIVEALEYYQLLKALKGYK
jgi:response regulator RpfG family c-di-GMP phosphodiesterase